MNGLMAIPNIIGLVMLSGVAATETRQYLARQAVVVAAEASD